MSKMILVIYKSLVMIILVNLHFCNSEMGPGKVVVNYIQKCPGFVGLDWNIRLYKHNRTLTTLSFNATMTHPFDDILSIALSVATMSNGAWKPNFYNFNFKGLCRSIAEYKPLIFARIAKSVNSPPKCPLPKGYYQLDNLDYEKEAEKMPTNMLPYGNFRVDLTVLNKNHKAIVCANVFIDIFRKKSGRKNKN